MKRINLPGYLISAAQAQALEGEAVVDVLCRLLGAQRQGPGGSETRYNQLYSLDLGESCLLEWLPRVKANVDRDQSALRMAVVRAQKATGWRLRTEGSPRGLLVTRLDPNLSTRLAEASVVRRPGPLTDL